MILAGDRIDATFGVWFGMSTMCAAGFGNLISDVFGVALGERIESLLGFEAPKLSPAQAAMAITRRAKMAAGCVGVALGCIIGMAPLLLMHDRKQVYFDDHWLELYQSTFAPHGVSAKDFFALAKLGHWRTAEAGTVLVHRGENLENVFLIHSGCAQAWEEEPEGGRTLRYMYAGRASIDADAQPPREGSALARTRSGSVMPQSGAAAADRDEVPIRNLIGGSALVDPALLGEPYPTEVVLSRKAQYVEWRTADLQEAMRDDKTIEAVVIFTLYRELANKVRRRRIRGATTDAASSRLNEYATMLRIVVADGIVHPAEKAMLREQAATHGIDQPTHEELLRSVGWTVAEYEEGVRSTLKQLKESDEAHESGGVANEGGSEVGESAVHGGAGPLEPPRVELLPPMVEVGAGASDGGPCAAVAPVGGAVAPEAPRVER